MYILKFNTFTIRIGLKFINLLGVGLTIKEIRVLIIIKGIPNNCGMLKNTEQFKKKKRKN